MLTIFNIAGHSLKDAGATYNDRKEADETIVARNLFAKYAPEGADIIVDSDTDNLAQTIGKLKVGKGSVVLDLHFNASENTLATGTEVYVKDADFRNKNSLSYKFAVEIAAAASNILTISNRGVKSETATRHKKLGILNTGAGISALWEICFISNKTDMIMWDSGKDILMQKISEIAHKYDKMID